MSPERAKVLIAEDDQIYLDEMEAILSEAGHKVVAKGRTRTEAEAMLSQIPELAKKYGREKIVVVLGGNLDGWTVPWDPQQDSQVLLRKMKEMGLGDIHTVGFSGNEVYGVTVDVGKGVGRLTKLVDTVTKL